MSEEQLGRIHIGEPALAFLDALPARVFRARAGSVRPLIDKAKGTATVRAEFDPIPEGPCQP